MLSSGKDSGKALSFQPSALSSRPRIYFFSFRVIDPNKLVSRGLRADSYLLNIHITQPATNTPPTNMAKQYRP
jgi:hypothetical protein